ncbi:MAG: hypothetical protein CMD83_11745 [Gammaproteobacteria bacterium]|nr:hypothetical protein [Gammaproteobacteria bacterium]MBS01883.1 hypothetical protein [Gammaproteobacteria bacterium]|tara:strand:- start:74 stop:961 length:888 start_codon:yes stop_codon:yes gene_type:complete
MTKGAGLEGAARVGGGTTVVADRAVRSLVQNGYCVFRQVLAEPLLSELRTLSERLCAAEPAERRERRLSQGTMLSTMVDPAYAELIAWAPALERLADLGFDAPTFTDGYVISKPPHSPRLFWHYDWFAWGDDSAYEPRPPQVFLMYYLTDTSPGNGCLRVIPGSHLAHNALHDDIGNPHAESLSRAEDLSLPAYSDRPDEVDVPVRAGDLVIGDARMLHAAHANGSDAWRTVITLWFQPDFAALPERVQAQMVRKTHPVPDTWPEAAAGKVRSLNPAYSGSAEAYGRDLYRPRSR